MPQSEWNQNAPAFLKLIGALPRTNGVAVPGGNNPELLRIFVQDQYQLRKRQEVVRVDYNLSSKTNFFFRWVDDAQDEDMGVGIFNASSFPYTPQFRKKPGSSWSWNLVNVISPTVTNEFIFGYNHLTQVVDIPDSVDKNIYDRDRARIQIPGTLSRRQPAQPLPAIQLRHRRL